MAAPTSLVDWRGNEYAVGSLILYPRKIGDSVEICEATVLVFTHKGHVTVRPTGKSSRNFHRTHSKLEYLDKDDNVVSYARAVQSGPNEYNKKYREVEVPIRPVTLSTTENITVITANNITAGNVSGRVLSQRNEVRL